MRTTARRAALALLLAAAALVASPLQAKVDELDLGPIPATGQQAVDGQPARSRRIVVAHACDDEVHFLGAIPLAQASGVKWPTSHLMAKAAFASGAYLAGQPFNWCSAKEDAPDLPLWESAFQQAEVPVPGKEPFRLRDEWAGVRAAADGPPKTAALASALSRYYAAAYGTACSEAVFSDGATLKFNLTPQCLLAQVRRVVTDPHLGPWKFENGKAIPMMPGTSSSKLPCILALPWFPLDETEGDWDMGVTEYTRLAHLIYAAKAQVPAASADADAALNKLNRLVLTLRGKPARELYDLVLSCGNPANSFGSAQDYVHDNDVYDNDVGKTVSGKDESESSFWKKLWRLLRFLAIAAAAAFAVGALLGALIGAGALATGAAVAAAAVSAIFLTGFWTTVLIGGIEETENHLFMQNSSKYLKNKLMMAELRAQGRQRDFNTVAAQNTLVRAWLLQRMHRVVEDDFVEYNAKPYGALSHEAILNLLDYACEVSWAWEAADWPPRAPNRGCDAQDEVIVTAAASVYDLSAAKAALGSSEGRRLIPFRRLVETNHQYRDPWSFKKDGITYPMQPRHFHDLFGNDDHLIAALQAWTASTQHGLNRHASKESIAHMMWYATSRYRPNALILDLAADKSSPIEQSYKHGGDEAYSSGPRWLLTAGGDSEHAAQGLRLNLLPFGILGADFNIYWLPFLKVPPDNDRGAGVPTTLMVAGGTERRDTIRSFLRFEGKDEDFGYDGGAPLKSFSNNRCVSGGFACGLRLEIPEPIRACLQASRNPDAPPNLKFISSADCAEYRRPGAGNDFFVAVYDHRSWGFLEVVEAKAVDGGSLQLFQDLLIAANKPHFADWAKSDGTNTLRYHSVVRKKTYKFEPEDEDFDRDCRACGSVVEGEHARFHIRNPRFPGQSIAIDYSNDTNPKRSGEGGLKLGDP